MAVEPGLRLVKLSPQALMITFKSCVSAFNRLRKWGSPAPVAGGAMGFADPQAGISYAYVTNRMATTLTGDPRDVALRDALYAVVGRS
jgi:hypothetical protein